MVTMELYDLAFYLFAAITVGSACVVAFSRNVVYAAFSLLFTFFGVAGIYVLLQADFLAVTQILIYVGGILVLMLFGIMLTNKVINVQVKAGAMRAWPAGIVTALVAGTLAGVFYQNWKDVTAPPTDLASTTQPIGEMLMTTYLLPFEVASVILLVALIGAALIARRHQKV